MKQGQEITQIQHHLQLSFKISNRDKKKKKKKIRSSLSKQVYLLP